MPEPGTVEVPAGLLRDYQAALDGLKGLSNGDAGYETARDKAAKAEEKLLSHLTANPGPNLDLGTAGQVLKDIRDMPRPEPPKPQRLYIYDDPVLDGPSSVRQPSQSAPPPPPPPAPPPQAAPKPAPRGERPKLPGSMAPYVGTNWDLFLDNDPDIPHQAVEQFRALIRENWGDFSPSEQGWLNGHGFYDEPKPLPPPSQPPNKTSLPDSPSSSNAISLPSVASAAGPLLILVGICLATFAGCALTTEDLGVAQIETASNANSSGAPAKAAVAIPAEPRFSIANGTVADVPTAPHIQSGSCSQSGISTQCNLQLSSDPASWASQTHGTVGITMSFDNNAVSISWQDAGGVAKPITSKGSATSGTTAAMAVQGPIVLVSLDGPKPTTWGAAIVIQRTPADAIHRATLGATASQGGTLPVTDLTRGGGKAVAPATGATAGAPVAAAGGNLNGGCNVIATAVGTHGDTVGVMSAPSAADAAHPFVLNWDGAVAYTGHSQGAIKDNSWHVDLFGIRVMNGGDDNKAGETSAQGTIKVSNFLPFRFTGLYPVSGGISGSGGACAGNTWVRLAGNPVGTVPWDAGLALAILGVFGLTSVAVAGRGVRP